MLRAHGYDPSTQVAPVRAWVCHSSFHFIKRYNRLASVGILLHKNTPVRRRAPDLRFRLPPARLKVVLDDVPSPFFRILICVDANHTPSGLESTTPVVACDAHTAHRLLVLSGKEQRARPRQGLCPPRSRLRAPHLLLDGNVGHFVVVTSNADMAR